MDGVGSLLLVTAIIIYVGLTGFILDLFKTILGEIRASRKLQREDLQMHQEWLFNQLYALGPGKVLRPDEFEPKAEAAPAKVYSPVEDPMSEFTGLKDDWHG